MYKYNLLIKSFFFFIFSVSSLNAQEFMGGDVRIERQSIYQCSVFVDIYYKADTAFQGHSIPLETVPDYVQRLDWVRKEIHSKGLVSFHYEAESFLADYWVYFKVDTVFVVEDVVNYHGPGELSILLDNFVRNSALTAITNTYITNFQGAHDSYYFDDNGILHYDLEAEDQEGNTVIFEFDPHIMLSSFYKVPDASNFITIDPFTGVFTWDKPLQPGKYFLPFYLSERLGNYPLDWKTRYQIIEITEEDIITNTQQEELAEGFDLFPNPANDLLQIQLPSLSTPGGLTIQNLQGQALYRKRIQLSPALQMHEIQVADWPAGVYVLRVQSGERQWVRKFVVE